MRREDTEQFIIELNEQNTVTHKFDKKNKIECTFDFQEAQFKECTNIICDSEDIILSNCHNLIIGSGNSGELSDCEYCTIKDNNSKIKIYNSIGVYIGSNNDTITVSRSNDIQINDNNNNITIDNKHTNIVGTNNNGIVINGNNNLLNNDNIDVVTADFNTIDNSTYVRVEGSFNEVKNSNSIDIKNSFSNKLNASKVITIANTNNNEISTTNLEVNNKNAFTKYITIDGNRQVKNINQHLFDRADSQGTTLNTKLNKQPSAERSKNNYYITKDVWQTDEKANFETFVVDLLPNPKSDYVVCSGGGEYVYNDMVRLNATVYNKSKQFHYWQFLDENDKELETITQNPYIFPITSNVKVIAIIKKLI